MADTFRIYKGDTKVVEGASPLKITGVAANTDVKAGDYKVVRVVDGKESDKVDIPAFKTLPIAVSALKLDQATASVEVGKTVTLKATVEPANATDKTVKFASSDAKIATVDGAGVVTAVAAGTADITATAGGKSAKCAVTVTAPAP
ncbi:Ig-like domain-containing protein [Enterococcus sp. CSURQ0835]|uniref:Ig-like domain-containing protein n=1 Tax=Enterococcus sp. CSURQ0835 TaxID=2681394 RepID=UPI00135953D3|nr:Ig-like domain-containing protein [Enterococcus sp. CSURQ0835]